MRLEIMVPARALRSGLVVVGVVLALMISRMSEDTVVAEAGTAEVTAIRIVIVRLMRLLI
jgi:hypothetical protein